MKKKNHQNKSNNKNKNSNVSLSIKYDDMNKKDEFKARIFERITIRILNILENKRP